MAIDGVKIIDSDDAYDIYNTIVGRYKNGENIAKIIENILNGDLKNYEGSVEWDNRELKQFDIKSAISTMNQKVQLLNLSIKDNIILNKKSD